MEKSMDWLQAVITFLGGGLVGTMGTHWATSRREAAARRTAFKKQQLEEFYGPLLAKRMELRARSELRVKLQTAVQEYIQDKSDIGPLGGYVEVNPQVEVMDANVQDENETFRDVLMPRYKEMISVFREKGWLAQPETRQFFTDLVEFVDVWDKILGKKLRHAIAARIGHTEKKLHPFYRHIEEVHDRLRSEIS
jgi:hypothetical protein